MLQTYYPIQLGPSRTGGLELSQRTSRIAFSARCECVYGAGVNIFSGSGWGSAPTRRSSVYLSPRGLCTTRKVPPQNSPVWVRPLRSRAGRAGRR